MSVWCGPFYRNWGTEGHILVSLPKLSEAYRCAGCRLCGVRTPGLQGYERRDNQVRFLARKNAARLLRQVRIEPDLRILARDQANAFPCRSIRSGCAASAEKAVLR